jgi:hypothetical protein
MKQISNGNVSDSSYMMEIDSVSKQKNPYTVSAMLTLFNKALQINEVKKKKRIQKKKVDPNFVPRRSRRIQKLPPV